MFLTGPTVVGEVTGEEIGMRELGGPRVHERNGVCDFVVADDRAATALAPRWARSVLTALARLDGRPVGVIASQPRYLGGVLDAESAQKAARFVERCDAFGLPLLVLVDTPGFMPGAEQESAGVIRFGATLVRAFARATVPRLTVVLRKAYGGAFIAMNSRDLGADLVFAWPGAEIGVMSAHSATTIVRHRELAAAADPIALRRALVEAYAEEHLGADVAAAGGFVVLAQLPTLLLVAEASLIFAGAQRSRYRDALGAQLTETTVPNGHNVLWEAPEQTISAIAGFLAGLT